MKVSGHVFYVTGGASGLGAATAKLLYERGALVGVWDLDLEAARSVADGLNSGEKNPDKSGQPRAMAAGVDVVSEEEVQAAIARCDELWPKAPVAGCVNCGGVGMAGKILNNEGEPFDLGTFQTVVDINLVGTFNVARLTAARMVRDAPRPFRRADASTPELGVIVNTASAAAFEGQTGQVSYSASKGGVVGMTLPMARDLANFGIRSMTLAPALFSTPMMERLPERAKQQILKSSEFPARFGNPEEFAHAVVAIIENPMLNGSTIRLDGATRLGKL